MKIVDLEKSWFDSRGSLQNSTSKHNLLIMQKYIDAKKRNAIEKSTDALVATAVKNAIVFNRVKNMDINSKNLLSKQVVYGDFKKFIKNLNQLPEIEREYFQCVLQKNLNICYKKYCFYSMMLDFEEAQNAEIIGRAIETVLDSIKGKNPTLEIVK